MRQRARAWCALAALTLGGCAERPTVHEPLDGSVQRDGSGDSSGRDGAFDRFPTDRPPDDRVWPNDRHPDAPDGTLVGARWTGFRLVRPESIAPIANIQLPGYFADRSLVVLIAARPSSGLTEILVGTGDLLTENPLAYGFANSAAPAPVLADTALRADGRRDFATMTTLEWSMPFIPGQPALPIKKANLTGSLNLEGVPTSDVPQRSGTAYGCIPASATDQVYIEVLGQSLHQLIESSGGQLDCGAGNGGLDGFVFEATWEATEIAQLVFGE